MELLLFHQAAGGDAYTQLTHRYQGYLDGSELIRNGRAILVGRIPDSDDAIWLNGKPPAAAELHHWAAARAVFPVRRPSR